MLLLAVDDGGGTRRHREPTSPSTGGTRCASTPGWAGVRRRTAARWARRSSPDSGTTTSTAGTPTASSRVSPIGRSWRPPIWARSASLRGVGACGSAVARRSIRWVRLAKGFTNLLAKDPRTAPFRMVGMKPLSRCRYCQWPGRGEAGCGPSGDGARFARLRVGPHAGPPSSPEATDDDRARPLVKVLVAGASGFVGRAAVPRPRGRRAHGAGDDPAPGWLPRGRRAGAPATSRDPASLRTALDGCEVAYYLVHSLGDADFEQRDADGAARVRAGRGRRGRRPHRLPRRPRRRARTTCRRTCAAAARSSSCSATAGVPVTTLRAGIIVGHGGISWEMTRQLVEHLPAMVAPRWVRTRTQPIAVADVVRYLVGVLDVPGDGGPQLRHRRPGGARVPDDDAPGRRDRGPPDARRAGPAADARRCRRAGCPWSPTWTSRPGARSSTR